MSSLMEYFKSRNQENVINIISIHVSKVIECIVEFEKGLTFLIEEKNFDLAIKVMIKVNELEHQADNIRRDILNKLSESELKVSVSENLSHLTKRIDDVANAANGCARIILYMNYEEFRRIDPDVHKKMLEMIHHTVEAVKVLKEMVNNLLSGRHETMQDTAKKVNLLEHKCDELHFGINRILVGSGSKYNINPFAAYEIMEMLTKLENISDNAESVADYLVTLSMIE